MKKHPVAPKVRKFKPSGSGKNFIKGAIKRPGALTKLVGGKPSQNPAKVASLAKTKGLAGQEARFYQNVLKK